MHCALCSSCCNAICVSLRFPGWAYFDLLWRQRVCKFFAGNILVDGLSLIQDKSSLVRRWIVYWKVCLTAYNAAPSWHTIGLKLFIIITALVSVSCISIEYCLYDLNLIWTYYNQHNFFVNLLIICVFYHQNIVDPKWWFSLDHNILTIHTWNIIKVFYYLNERAPFNVYS